MKKLYKFLKKFKPRKHIRVITALIIAVVLISIGVYVNVFSPPPDFPKGKVLTVRKGASISEISDILEQEKIVRSGFWLKNAIIFLKGETTAFAGDYYFPSKHGLLNVARRIVSGDYGTDLVRVTIQEGLSTFQIANHLESTLEGFDAVRFIEMAQPKEGYLFPDTYYWPINASPELIISDMEKNFNRRTRAIIPDIEEFKYSLPEVIIMASLLEAEARTMDTRRTIAGILWKRLEMGMPLQVDAVFPYIIGKNTYEVTLEDLKFDSPYNTYLYAGLPQGPINNPGLAAIQAAITPIETDYLFFLSDLGGRMYYGRNHAEHVYNRQFLQRR